MHIIKTKIEGWKKDLEKLKDSQMEHGQYHTRLKYGGIMNDTYVVFDPQEEKYFVCNTNGVIRKEERYAGFHTIEETLEYIIQLFLRRKKPYFESMNDAAKYLSQFFHDGKFKMDIEEVK